MSRSAPEESLLTPSELAKYLHMTEKTVLKLATSKKLPGVLIDHKWRFKRGHIDEWLETQAKGGSGDFQEEPDGMKVPLGDLLPEEGIIQDMGATTPLGAIEELVGRAYINRWVADRDWMVSALIEREGLSSTAMEGGVAFLHTRLRDTGKLTRPFIIVGRSYNGIEFGAPDGRPTFLFFLLGLKYDKLHLPILGRLARIMHTTRTVTKLRATTSPVKMRSLLLQLDAKALTWGGKSPLGKSPATTGPQLDRELRLRAIMRISARKQYEAKKAKLEEDKKSAKAAGKGRKAAAAKASKTASTAKTSAKGSRASTRGAAARSATTSAAAKPTATRAAARKKPAGTSKSSAAKATSKKAPKATAASKGKSAASTKKAAKTTRSSRTPAASSRKTATRK